MIALIGSPDPVTLYVASRLRARGESLVLCEMRDTPRAQGDDAQHLSFRLEHLGTLLSRLVAMGVTEACLIGAVRHPVIDPSQIDAATAPLAERLARALGEGDDGALRTVIDILEEASLRVRAAHEIAPELLPPAGFMSRKAPSPRQLADADRAEAVHRIVAPADIGQAIIVRTGRVQAVEAAPGTQAMIEGAGRNATEDALFFKAPKAGQDRRVDLPLIGPATIEQTARAGIGAVVLEAGGVMVLRPEECARLADEAGMVLWVREPGP